MTILPRDDGGPGTIAAAQAELRAGTCSAVELVGSALARIERLDPSLNAFLHLDAEGALEAARATDARAEPLPLDGIPICVKDVIDVAEMPTSAGAAGWSRQPSRDATAVERLRSRGAIVLGKGNTNEFAYGIDGRNPHWGDCRNPHDRSRISGGSSSGPAVAVASGMALGGLGTDTTGSLRAPASLCGVVGLRPTLGLVPATGVVPLAPTYDTVGPLAANVEDAAILLDALTAAASGAPAEELAAAARQPLDGARIAICEELLALATAPISKRIRALAVGLEDEGATIVPAPLPELGRAAAFHQTIQTAEAATAHRPWFEGQSERYGKGVRARLEAGLRVTATEYLEAQGARRRFLAEVAEAMRGVDVLLAPATPDVAPALEAEEMALGGRQAPLREALLSCLLPISQLGWPALSLPAGSEAGVPFGAQLVGRSFKEASLLRVAAAIERLAAAQEGWRARRG